MRALHLFVINQEQIDWSAVDYWAFVESWSMRYSPFIPYVGETSLHMLWVSLDVNHLYLQSVINNELHDVPIEH